MPSLRSAVMQRARTTRAEPRLYQKDRARKEGRPGKQHRRINLNTYTLHVPDNAVKERK